MNRLTDRISGYPHGKAGRTLEIAEKQDTFKRGTFEATAIVERLCEYEDTGLTPEEIVQLKEKYDKLTADYDRLHEEAKLIDRNAASVQREYQREIQQLKSQLRIRQN